MKYEQLTPEGCLPVCLMNLVGKSPSKNKEIEFLTHAFRFTKFDYALGNLDFFAKKCKKNIFMIVGNKTYASFLRSINKDPRISIISGDVSIETVDELLTKGRAIAYLDAYFVGSDVHVPHFVVIERVSEGFYEISDPWDGKTKKFPKSKMLKCMTELKRRFYFAPKLIQVNQ